MRLWHVDLIPYLPKSQLLAQWRELNSIFKKQDKHILINYIYDYPKEYLYNYSSKVMNEFINRGFHIRNYENFNKYFQMLDFEKCIKQDLRYTEHNKMYLYICYHNLLEKYIRGQKDFDYKRMYELTKFVNGVIDE
jgi:uncharacterized protein (TIGR02328 family)